MKITKEDIRLLLKKAKEEGMSLEEMSEVLSEVFTLDELMKLFLKQKKSSPFMKYIIRFLKRR